MALRRFLFAWLAFALLAAQSLAFVHRVAHGPQAQPAAAHAGQSPHEHEHEHEHEDAEGHAHLSHLFAGHEDAGVCLLLDAVGHDAAPWGAALALPLALPAALFARSQGEFLARFSALFDARGPPSIR